MGIAHLVWECPDTQAHWRCLVEQWTGVANSGVGAVATNEIKNIFGFKMDDVPRWLVEWGREQTLEPWETLHTVAEEMWAIGCAVTVTAIWRMNVDRVHPDGQKPLRSQERLQKYNAMVKEAFERCKWGTYPLTRESKPKLQVAEQIIRRW
ncbi:hypothetical protein PF001_g32372 [Phytophthora fragariae]|uniref:Uncharacterized protein n=1 Tax=Phytophthora fragariae TaxID=53985 RepID=A0A6A4ARC9_9STRA|nr:hypothetical protein PF001_g32372 [Phytophthora fragariae]